MMAAVHLARVGVAQPLAHQPRQQRVLLEPDLVRERVRLVRRHRQAVRRARRCTCDGMSCTSVPPQATFSTWMPRQIARIGRSRAARGRDERDLELVARRLGVDDRRVRRLAVARRRDVVAAGQQQAVDAVRARRSTGHRAIDDADLAADVEDRLPVVLELAARVMPMSGHDELRIVYIRVGTSIPIRSSARVSCARTYATPAARQRFRSASLLVEDRIAVIERVEQLREPERVLRQHREFERPHDLLDDVVETRRLEDDRPEVVRSVSRRRRSARRRGATSSAASTSASDSPSRSCSLWKMLFARTTAYCRYGPVSPSKLSASSMSNTISLPRENFSMK